MQRITQGSLVFYQFDSFSGQAGLSHGLFTRLGGVSAPPFDSLNVGSTVGDDPACVHANRERMAGALGVRDRDTRTTWQVHGRDVLVIRGRDPQVRSLPQADGIVTAERGLPLVMRFADCVPLVFYDPVKRVTGLAHAGWRSTILGIGPATVETMRAEFGCRPQDILAGIGPSIGPCCYEVGPEVVAQVREAFDDPDALLRPPSNGDGAHFDLWAANDRALRRLGLDQIERACLCTSCNIGEFYSHRAEKGRTGRAGVLVVLGGA